MRQYKQIKSKYPDAMLLFRVGDFYETFGQDAVVASQILNITLTSRNNNADNSELAGFPYHAINTYLPKLVKAGLRVAICDQLEDPKQTKTIVKRGVTELVTPGVALNDEILQAKKNNFLASVYFDKETIGVSFLDVSTGEFLMAQGDKAYVEKLLDNFSPSEVLVQKQERRKFEQTFSDQFNTFFLEQWIYKEQYARECLTKQFNSIGLKGFGVDDLHQGIISAGAIIFYLSQTQHHSLKHISAISRIPQDDFLWMDKFTIRNLELYEREDAQVSLINVIDKTLSPMGGRTIRRWLSLPLKNIEKIRERHLVVEEFFNKEELREKIREILKRVWDIERLISKIATERISPTEVVGLGKSMRHIANIKQILQEQAPEHTREIALRISPCQELIEKIEKTIREDTPANLAKGGVIKQGISQELDSLRDLSHSTKKYLDQMLQEQIEKTGISSLKIDSNNVFGYYIEVRNTHKDKVPESWHRKQTLVSAERYITQELKEFEAKILTAEEKIMELEGKLYKELVLWIENYIEQIKINANIIGYLDVLCGFATLAKEQNYCKAQMDEGFDIEIKQGRHPVIEKQLPVEKPYISNDISLSRDDCQIMMITGPNMSGKSAVLRQTALIVILAQIGSFVPAEQAKIGVVDKIFTRVGASDNISQGESTFMVEMNEAALILNNISKRSLVLLDEIGRGTSTYDGISIAWAIAQYLHNHPARPKTLFATHYHELNDMSLEFERIKNFNVSVKETKDSVLFLRKLTEGGSQHSFGIWVAKMAGMPQMVIENANKILKKLEKKTSSTDGDKNKDTDSEKQIQLQLFSVSDPVGEEIKKEIEQIDINLYTPVEALIKLNELKKKIENSK